MADHDARHRDERETVDFLDDVTSSVRSRLALFWYPMMLFGSLNLIGAATAALFGPPAFGLLWLIGGAIGAIMTARFYRRTELSSGLRRSAHLTYAVLAVLAVGVFAIPVLLSDPGWALCCWVGLCYLGFAVTERDGAVALAASALVLVGLALRLFSVDRGLIWASLAMGFTLVSVGYLSYRRHVRPSTG